jgi:hypothetical protein
MNPEIEELRKFSKTTLTKARLGKLRAALSNATTLFHRLEPKPGDENAAEDFKNAQSELESAIGELESACDYLEAAEDKDEREDAKDQISSALEEALNYFDEIMLGAVVGDAANAKTIAECLAELRELALLPNEQRGAHLRDWLASAPTAEESKKRRAWFQAALKTPPTF